MINKLQEMKRQEKQNHKLCLALSNESYLLESLTMQSILNVSSSFYKNNLLMLFGFNNNRKDCNTNDIDELDNLINVIEKKRDLQIRKK